MDKKRPLRHQNDPVLQAYGMKVANEMVGLTARLLLAPMLAFGGNMTSIARNGEWGAKSFKFYKVLSFYSKLMSRGSQSRNGLFLSLAVKTRRRQQSRISLRNFVRSVKRRV